MKACCCWRPGSGALMILSKCWSSVMLGRTVVAAGAEEREAPLAADEDAVAAGAEEREGPLAAGEDAGPLAEELADRGFQNSEMLST
jgi:hypothetical protein